MKSAIERHLSPTLAAGYLVFASQSRAQLATVTNLGPNELVVAADGSGHFKSVNEAVFAAPTGSSTNWTVIRIKPGVYRELVYVQRERRFLRLRGENAGKTARFTEHNSRGPGANTAKRAPWARQLGEVEAHAVTPRKVLGGTDGWNPTSHP